MEIMFLGTGTSTGIPQLGCNCDTCRSEDPRDNRMRCSAIVTLNNGHVLLIDCGPDFRTQMLRFARDTRPDALLVTHTHYDHVGGLDDLRPFCHPEPFNIYCRRDVADTIVKRMPYCFGPHPYPGSPRLSLHKVREFKPVEVCGTEVLPLPVRHGSLDILGYRIGSRLGYITDASVVPETTIDALRGIDTLVINALRHEPHPSHMNLTESLDVIKAIGPRRALLTHMAHQIGRHAEVSAQLPQGVEFAYDGLRVNL